MKELPPIVIEALEARIAPATFTVTTLRDTTDAGHDTGSLRDAIFNANLSSDAGNSIVFDVHGTIRLTFDLPAISLESGSSLSIAGPVAGKTTGITINGNGHEIFSILSGAVTMQDLTVTGGIAGLNLKSQPIGGGISIDDSSAVQLTDVRVSGNHAEATRTTTLGGGIYIAAVSDVTISKSSITGNSSTSLAGGNAYGAGILCRGTLDISNSVITGNVARGGNNTGGGAGGNAYGGGIYASLDAGNVSITNSTITGNRAIGGNGGAGARGHNGGEAGSATAGGVYNYESTLTISGTTISGNVALGGVAGAGGGAGGKRGDGAFSRGGGIVSRDGSASTTIHTSTISGNRTTPGRGGTAALSYGGGIYSNRRLYVYDTAIAGNSASAGGGIYAAGSDSATLVQRTTISGNRAVTGGGAQVGLDSTFTIQDSTIARNAASTAGAGLDVLGGTVKIHNDTVAANILTSAKGVGGGVDASGLTASVSIVSTIIAGNRAHTGADLFSAASPVVTASFDLVQTAPAAGTFTNNGSDIFGENPLLGALAKNGGLTLTMLPRPTSPVVNSGDNPDSLTTDQRGAGFARTVGAAMGDGDGTDIGAVELQ